MDVILEMLANVNLAKDMKLLALHGRVIVIGNRGEITINPRELMARRAMVRGFTLWAAPKRSPSRFTLRLPRASKTARSAQSSARNFR